MPAGSTVVIVTSTEVAAGEMPHPPALPPWAANCPSKSSGPRTFRIRKFPAPTGVRPAPVRES